MSEEQIKVQPDEQVQAEDLKVLAEGENPEVVQACCSSGASAKIR
jgi:hypothetical protein